MTNINRLEDIVRSLRDNAQKFSAAATHLQQQTQRLDWSADDLASSSATWAGQGSQAFQIAWQVYHDYTLKSKKWLSGTADAMNKLAQDIDDQVQQIQEAQLEVATITLITIGLGVLDVAQLGLDPITDAATAGSGGVDSAAINQVEAATAAIVEVDIQAGTELDEIASQIETTILLSDTNGVDGDLGGTDMNLGGEPDGTSDQTPAVNAVSPNGLFPWSKLSPYNPINPLIEQTDEKACAAACMRMVLQDEGLDVSEKEAMDAAQIGPQGINFRRIGGALDKLGAKTEYSLSVSDSISDVVSKANGKPIITSFFSTSGHAIIVDGTENGMVLVRDPLGSSYKVPMDLFNQYWSGIVITP